MESKKQKKKKKSSEYNKKQSLRYKEQSSGYQWERRSGIRGGAVRILVVGGERIGLKWELT